MISVSCNVGCVFAVRCVEDVAQEAGVRGPRALVQVEKNLVDELWDDRPPRPINPVIVQPLQWTGNFCIADY